MRWWNGQRRNRHGTAIRTQRDEKQKKENVDINDHTIIDCRSASQVTKAQLYITNAGNNKTPISPIAHRAILAFPSSLAFLCFNLSAYAGSNLEVERDSAESTANIYFGWLLVFTAVTAIGVLLELPEEIPHFKIRTCLGRLQWRVRNWPKRLVAIGAIAVVVGVSGEVVFEGLMVLAERDARKKDNEIIARDESLIESNKRSLSERLEKATEDARLEKEELDASAKRAGEQLSKLEKQFRTQGPRYVLLRKAAPNLAKDLAPFAGQRAALLICGMYRTKRETLNTWGVLASILGPDTVEGVKGADWKMVRGDPIWDKCSLSMQGIAVLISSVASRGTRDAAEALSKELLKTLPRYNKMPSVVDPKFIQTARRFMDKDDPQKLAADDPNLVVVFIGEHPPQ